MRQTTKRFEVKQRARGPLSPCQVWWRMKSDRHQTWYGDKGPRARSFTFKMFGV